MNNLNTLLKKLSVIQMHFETLSKANETFNIFNEYPFGYLIFQNQDIRATPLKIQLLSLFYKDTTATLLNT